MEKDISFERAKMPQGTNTILDRRTLFNSNKNLIDIIKPGQTVLDVGCGSGSITKDIIELVGKNGKVIGIDTSEHLIELARKNYGNIANLHFEAADINDYTPSESFDVITSARVLQWLNNPKEILLKMVSILKKGGCISILDYNHEKIEWQPAIPESMSIFYAAFLKWRKDAGFDNTIGDNLPLLFESIGMINIITSDQSEISKKEDKEFYPEAGIWSKVAETRGLQMQNDGYIKEEQRLKAIEEYNNWVSEEGSYMKMYLKATTGNL